MADKSKEIVYAKRQQSYKSEKEKIFEEAHKEAAKKQIVDEKKEEKE